MGKEGMKNMSKSNVLISGMGGLGVEISKNVILAGVKSVTLHDTNSVSDWDLSSQYYFTEQDIGKNRALTCVQQLSDLNAYVSVSALSTTPLTPDIMLAFNIIVLTNSPNEETTEISKFCHHNNIKLVVARTGGLFGQIFCDFGPNHMVNDATGEDPLTVMIQDVQKDEDGLVVCLEETRHGFETGDYVTFSEVKGMIELNDCEPRKIKVEGPNSFKIGDTSALSSYVSGGICSQVKMPVIVAFKTFEEAYKQPEFVISDYAKFDRPQQLHVLFYAIDLYQKLFPAFRDEKGAGTEKFLQLAREASSVIDSTMELDEKLALQFLSVYEGSVIPMQAVIGGIAAQEVLKACSCKFFPIKQFFYFDALECLPEENRCANGAAAAAADNSVKNGNASGEADQRSTINRYKGQIAVFGRDYQEKLSQLKIFLVGAGAIGCELLKNFVMMGVGARVSEGDKSGKIILTDMDSIEKSNLNRQFLFRTKDIGQLKSATAAAAATQMNAEVDIEALEIKVGRETESYFNDAFFNGIDVVANALDNVEARQYMDRRCVFYLRPLLESGTLGTKGNVQVILPNVTESYSSSQDPPEKSIPVCTIKNFPYSIEHTIQWSRDLFEGLFSQPSAAAHQFLSVSLWIEWLW